jgi:hypothetical protein
MGSKTSESSHVSEEQTMTRMAKLLSPTALSDGPIAIGSMMEELVAALGDRVRLQLRTIGNPLTLGNRRALRGALSGALHSALGHCWPHGVVRVAVGQIGTGIFVEINSNATIEGGARLRPATEDDLSGEQLTLAVADSVIKAHGGGLRVIEEGEWLILIYLPLAAAA